MEHIQTRFRYVNGSEWAHFTLFLTPTQLALIARDRACFRLPGIMLEGDSEELRPLVGKLLMVSRQPEINLDVINGDQASIVDVIVDVTVLNDPGEHGFN